MIKLNWGHKFYLPARGITTTLALIFALFYSRELGVLSRSYLALIMTSSILIAVSLTSGTTLTLRAFRNRKAALENAPSFNSLIICELVFGLSFFCIVLLFFSKFRYQIHPNLLIVALIYFLASFMHLILFEILIALGEFKLVSICDISTIVLQILFFSIFHSLENISILNQLLFSFILSYICLILFIFKHLRIIHAYSTKLSNPVNFLDKCKGNHSIGIAIGVSDRVDRIIIAWFLPLALLGKYAVMSSFISFLRFIPEAAAKLFTSTKSQVWKRYLSVNYYRIGLILFVLAFVISSRYVINYLLGPQWILPWIIYFLFALQELLRGAFLLKSNSRILAGKSSESNAASLGVLLTAIPLAIMFSWPMGIAGITTGFCISYALMFSYLKLKTSSD